MERVFLDANVLVSAALKPAPALLALWRLSGVRLLASPHVLTEARRNMPDPAAASRLEDLVGALAVLPSEPDEMEIAEAPTLPAKDRQVLFGAIAASADVLLTGDPTHFGLCMGRTFGGVMVMLPGAYLRERG